MQTGSAIRMRSATEPSDFLHWPANASSEKFGCESSASFQRIQAVISGRANVSPKRLSEPGPSREQLGELLSLAVSAPDHGQLSPWRFLLIPKEHRHRLGDAFAAALIERSPSATLEQIESAREKALRAPLLLVAIACWGGVESNIPETERLVSLGAAIQNVLLGSCAMGFGSGLTSGQAMNEKPLRDLFRLRSDEAAVCFINIGTVNSHKASKRERPNINDIFSVLIF